MSSEFKYKNSIYPYIQAYYVYSNQFSKQLLSNSLLKENPKFRYLFQNLFDEFFLKNIQFKYRYEIESTLVNISINYYLYENVPFLRNSDFNVESMNKERNRILGIEAKKIGYIGDNNFQDFKVASAANKLLLLQNYSNRVGLNSRQIDYINSLEVNSGSETIKLFGYEIIGLKDIGLDSNYLKQVFLSLYYHNNEHVRDCVRDLIRYTFLTTGFNKQIDISKDIPIYLFLERPNNFILSKFRDLCEINNQLWRYSSFFKF